MKRLAVIACVLFVATIAAGAIAVHFIDPRSLALSLAASIKADTGRELSFADVDINLLPRPTLVVSELRFGNTAQGSQPWLAQIDRVSIKLKLFDLLAGRLHVASVALADASVLLETDPDGKGNWVMGSADASAPAWLKALDIDELELHALAFTYRDGISGKATSVRLDSARIEHPLAPRPIRLGARFGIDGQSAELAGTIGALALLMANAPAYPIDLECKLAVASASVHGTIDQPLGPGGLNLALAAQAPEFAALAKLLGAATLPSGSFRGTALLSGALAAPGLSAIDLAIDGQGTPGLTLRGTIAHLLTASGIDLQLAAVARDWWHSEAAAGLRLPPFVATARLRDAPQGYRLDDLELRVADSRVNASLQVVKIGQRLRVTGKVASPRIDLARPRSGTGTSAAAATTSAAPGPAGQWTFADLDLDLEIGQLILPDGRQLQSGSGRLALDSGRLRLNALQATLGGAKIRLDGSIAEPRKLAGLDLDVAVQGDELAELFKFFGTPIPPLGAYQGQAHLDGSRAALRATKIEGMAGRSGQNLRASGQVDDVLALRGIQLAISANVSDSAAAGRLFGADWPPLPALRATANLSELQGDYVFDKLRLALGHTSVQGRIAFAPGDPRPRVTADLKGPLVDFSELLPAPPQTGARKPLPAADIDATLQFDRVLLPSRRVLGPVSGEARFTAGALELKQFTIAVQGASATFDGRIDDPLNPGAVDLTVNAGLTRGAGLAALTGAHLQDLPAFTVRGKLTNVPNGYALTGIALTHAATTISGDVAVTRGPKRLKIDAKLNSPFVDVGEFLPSAVKGTQPAAAGARVIPDVAFPLDVLNSIDGKFDLNVDTLKFSDAPTLGPLLVHAEIVDGHLEAGPVRLAVQAGNMLTASVILDAGSAAWSGNIEGGGIDLGQLLAQFGHPALITGGRTDLSLRVRGRGRSLAAVIGSFDGTIQFTVGPLLAHNLAANMGRGIVMRTISMVNPFQKTDPDTDVKCIAARVPIKHGVLTSERRFAVETAKYNVVWNGSIDLRNERLDLAVLPIVPPSSGVGAGELASIVRLRGTLADPALGVDAAGVAKSAVSLGATVATFGGWWLADTMLKQVKSDRSPCATALAP